MMCFVFLCWANFLIEGAGGIDADDHSLFSIEEVNGFLHQVNSSGVFRCWGSNTTYTIVQRECPGTYYSAVCENDMRFYQACGARNRTCNEEYHFDEKDSLCGVYICTYWSRKSQMFKSVSGNTVNWHFECDGQQNCVNPNHPNIDERFCDYGADPYICKLSNKRVARDKQCDGVIDCLPDLADDEVGCNHTYGLECMWPPAKHIRKWQPPWGICGGNNNPLFGCVNGTDEIGCNNPVGWCYSDDFTRNSTLKKRNLTQLQMCSPHYTFPRVCRDGRDQVNCTESAVTCQVDSYLSNITQLGLCTGYPICDDEIDEMCRVAEYGCNTHKHTLCDGISDCVNRGDETGRLCDHLIDNEKCPRRVSLRRTAVSLPIPTQWLCDGIEDCADGRDEDRNYWKVCGSDETKIRCVGKNQACSELYRCDQTSNTNFIDFNFVCDGIQSCANELKVCEVSKDMPSIPTEVVSLDSSRLLLHCLPGLEELQTLTQPPNTCSENTIGDYVSRGYGLEKIKLNHPREMMQGHSCIFSFGEIYVYLSCMGICENKDITCPLKPLTYKSCLDNPSRIFTLSEDRTSLVMAKRSSYAQYSNVEMFSCSSGLCIPYSKVCNLADDCGDGSDEADCFNHFKCGSGEYISFDRKCDGEIHCLDGSDECVDCSLRLKIIDSLGLKVSAWIIGILAVIINTVVIFLNIKELVACKTSTSLLNYCLLTLISLGDFMTGSYLLGIAIVDFSYSDSYCLLRYEWMIDAKCSALGTLNTVGSQLSIFAMTFLSIFRAVVIKRVCPSQLPIIRDYIVAALIVGFLGIASIIIAITPLLKTFEDFFLNGLYYGNEIPLFVGVPNKKKHIEILEVYYGRFGLHFSMSWNIVRGLISDMFTSDHSRIVGRDWGFYGNDGVCLFKYFVKKSDPQLGYSWTLLIINLLCFTVISISYIYVNLTASNASRRASGAGTKNRTRTMQRKISLIIASDLLCWVPFIVICLLHFTETIDATHWYSFCSIVILPLNSVVNPVLYQNKLITIFDEIMSRILLKNNFIGAVQNIKANTWAGMVRLFRRNRTVNDDENIQSHSYSNDAVELDDLEKTQR